MTKKILKWTVFSLAVLFLGAQLFRPEQTNPVSDPKNSILSDTTIPPSILATLKRSCFDCHSNETRWPWYCAITPVNYLLARDVSAGRKRVNFSDWGTYKPGRRLSVLDEIYDQVSHKEMPLPIYLPMHPEAKLTDQEVKAILDWSEAAQEDISDQN
ncbi:MAG: heme-binding domain-containing protein [Bacteroidota bacterium]